MPLRSITFLLYFFSSSAATLAYPMAGIICYMILYQIYPQTTWWGEPLNSLGIRYSFVCGICLIIGTVLNVGRLRFGREAVHPVEVGTALVVLFMLLSTVTGTGWNHITAVHIDKMMKVLLFLMIMTHVVTTRHRLWMLALIFTFMAWYLGHEATNAPPSAFNKNRIDGIGGPDFREASSLAIHICALLPFIVLVLREKKIWTRLMAILAAVYASNAILLCQARSAFVAMIITALAAIVYAPKRHRRWVTIVLILGAIGGFILSDDWFWIRMGTILETGEERDQSAAIRLIIWEAAWDLFKDNPLGVGVGQFQFQIKNYAPALQNRTRDAHNSYILAACEMGLFGFMTYIGTLGLSWWSLGRASKRARNRLADPEIFEFFIFANRLSLLVYMISGLFVSRLYTEGAWWFIVMPVCISRAIENEIRDEAREAMALQAQLPKWLETGGLPQLAPQ